MGRPRTVLPNWNELVTIWTISDELREEIAPILAEVDPPKAMGRSRVANLATIWGSSAHLMIGGTVEVAGAEEMSSIGVKHADAMTSVASITRSAS